MNRIFFITFVAISILSSSIAFAQEGKQHRHFNREAFQAKRNAYITAEVGLTPEEAAVFIPLCNELQQKMFEVGRDCRQLTREIRSKENPTEAEYLQVIDACVGVNLKEAEVEKEFYEKFKKVLSPQKIYKYRRADLKFAREYVKGGKGN